MRLFLGLLAATGLQQSPASFATVHRKTPFLRGAVDEKMPAYGWAEEVFGELPRRVLAENTTEQVVVTADVIVDATDAPATTATPENEEGYNVGELLITLVTASGFASLVGHVITNVKACVDTCKTEKKEKKEAEKEFPLARHLIKQIPLDGRYLLKHSWDEFTGLCKEYEKLLLRESGQSAKTTMSAGQAQEVAKQLKVIMLADQANFALVPSPKCLSKKFRLSRFTITFAQARVIQVPPAVSLSIATAVTNIKEILNPGAVAVAQQAPDQANFDPRAAANMFEGDGFHIFPDHVASIVDALEAFRCEQTASRVVAVRSQEDKSGYGRNKVVAQYFTQAEVKRKYWVRAHSVDALLTSMQQIAETYYRQRYDDPMPVLSQFEWVQRAIGILELAELVVFTHIRDMSILREIGMLDMATGLIKENKNRQIVLVIGLYSRWNCQHYPELTIRKIQYTACKAYVEEHLPSQVGSAYALWNAANRGVPLHIVLVVAAATHTKQTTIATFLREIAEIRSRGVEVEEEPEITANQAHPPAAVGSLADSDSDLDSLDAAGNDGGSSGDDAQQSMMDPGVSVIQPGNQLLPQRPKVLRVETIMPENPDLAAMLLGILSHLKDEHPTVHKVLSICCPISDFVLSDELMLSLMRFMVRDQNQVLVYKSSQAALDGFKQELREHHLMLPSPAHGIVIRSEVLKVLCSSTHASPAAIALNDLIHLITSLNDLSDDIFETFDRSKMQQHLHYCQSVEHLVIFYEQRFVDKSYQQYIKFLEVAAKLYYRDGQIWRAYGLLKTAHSTIDVTTHYDKWLPIHFLIIQCQIRLGYASRALQKLQAMRAPLQQKLNQAVRTRNAKKIEFYRKYLVKVIDTGLSVGLVQDGLDSQIPVPDEESEATAAQPKLPPDFDVLNTLIQQMAGESDDLDAHQQPTERNQAHKRYLLHLAYYNHLRGDGNDLTGVYEQTQAWNPEIILFVSSLRYIKATSDWYRGAATQANQILDGMLTYTHDLRVYVFYGLLLKAHMPRQARRLFKRVLSQPGVVSPMMHFSSRQFPPLSQVPGAPAGRSIPNSPLLTTVLHQRIRKEVLIEPWLVAMLQTIPMRPGQALWAHYEKIVVRYLCYRQVSATAEMSFIVITLDSLRRYKEEHRANGESVAATRQMQVLKQIMQKSLECVDPNGQLAEYIEQELKSIGEALTATPSHPPTPAMADRAMVYSNRSRLAVFLAPLASPKLRQLLDIYPDLDVPQWVYDFWRVDSREGHPCEYWLRWVDRSLSGDIYGNPATDQSRIHDMTSAMWDEACHNISRAASGSMLPPSPPDFESPEKADDEGIQHVSVGAFAAVESDSMSSRRRPRRMSRISIPRGGATGSVESAAGINVNEEQVVDLSFAMLALHICRLEIFPYVRLARAAVDCVQNMDARALLLHEIDIWISRDDIPNSMQPGVATVPSLQQQREKLKRVIEQAQIKMVEGIEVSPRRVFEALRRNVYDRGRSSSEYRRFLTSRRRASGQSAAHDVDSSTDEGEAEGSTRLRPFAAASSSL